MSATPTATISSRSSATRRGSCRRRPEPVREPDLADDGGEPESRFARRAKLAGLVAAGALVAGAVVAAPMLTSAHRAASAGGQSTPGRLQRCRGARRPRRAAAPGRWRRAGAARARPRRARIAGGSPSAEEPTGGSTADPRRSRATANTVPDKAADARSAARKIQAVKDFYAAIARDSSGALAQLSPSLADGAAGELVRTWSSMDAIDVQEADTQIKPDGSILAVATLHRPDGAPGARHPAVPGRRHRRVDHRSRARLGPVHVAQGDHAFTRGSSARTGFVCAE